MTLHLRRLRRHALFAVALAAILVGSLSGADAMPSGGHVAKVATARAGADDARSARSTSVKGPYGIPPINNPDPVTGGPLPWKADATAATTATRSKVAVSLPALRTSTYVDFCFAFPTGAGPATETCCPDPTAANCIKINPPASDYDSSGNVTYTQISGPTWINSPRSAKVPFGTFPPTRVHTLGFGSIPISATVQLSQVVGSDGYYKPLDLVYAFSNQYPVGSKIDGWGTVPSSPFAPGSGAGLYLRTRLNGPVYITISDVVLDGRRVDVGNSCRTAVPAALTLGSPAGLAPAATDDTPVSAYYGRPGAFTAVTGAQLYGNIDIPRFSGCGAKGDDLDPLVTNFISAARNPVTITLTSDLNECDPPDPKCPQVPTLPQTSTANAVNAANAANAVRAGSSARGAATLSAPGVQVKVARAISAMPVRERVSALNSLPAAVRNAVRARIRH